MIRESKLRHHSVSGRVLLGSCDFFTDPGIFVWLTDRRTSENLLQSARLLYPFMAVIYFGFSIALILFHIREVPAAVVTVVNGAFNPAAVTGGVVGSMIVAMQKGVARVYFFQ